MQQQQRSQRPQPVLADANDVLGPVAMVSPGGSGSERESRYVCGVKRACLDAEDAD